MSKESDALEIYQELKFLGPQDSFGTFEKALVANLVPPWRRAVETERDLKAVQVDALVFELMGNALATTTAKVFLSRREFGYEVTNIVPNFGSLTRAAYNTVLSLFLETVARPAAVHAGFDIDLGEANLKLEDWLPPQSAELLRRFSNSANKSTGASHPLDGRRWRDFLFGVHAERGFRNDGENLLRWLMEVERWPEEQAWDLATQYDFALELLAEYDRRKR